jgi:hypothetical protein
MMSNCQPRREHGSRAVAKSAIVVVLPSCAERYLSTAFFEKFATIENHLRSLPVVVPHIIANALAQTPMALMGLGSAVTSD